MNRRAFLGTSVAAPAAVAAALGTAAPALPAAGAMEEEQTSPARRPERGPALAGEQVKAFVMAAHGDLEKVKAMLAEQPRLVNAVWDWGGGDFESALGGAAHTGHADIARYLLEKGARLDLFTAAMLGRTEVVRAVLAAFPEALHTPGPHGIPLLAHAKVGGEAAQATRAYLESLLPGVKPAAAAG